MCAKELFKKHIKKYFVVYIIRFNECYYIFLLSLSMIIYMSMRQVLAFNRQILAFNSQRARWGIALLHHPVWSWTSGYCFAYSLRSFLSVFQFSPKKHAKVFTVLCVRTPVNPKTGWEISALSFIHENNAED